MQDQTQMLNLVVLRPSKTPRGALTGYEMRFLTSNLEEGEVVETGVFGNSYYKMNESPVTMARDLTTSKLFQIDAKIKALEAERNMVVEATEVFCKGQEGVTGVVGLLSSFYPYEGLGEVG